MIISKLWSIKQVSGIYVDEPNETSSKVRVNNLSRIYSRNLFNGLKFRISLFLSIIRKGKIPVFGVAYAKAPLLKYGFYNKLFDDLDLNWPIGEHKVNDSLRSKVFTPDIFCCSELDKFYESQKITLKNNFCQILNVKCDFLRIL